MHRLIRLIESILNCKIYRNTLPRGTDIATDIKRSFGIHTIRTVFDVGANIGQSAVKYSQIFPAATIHSFEPVSSTFEQLKETVSNLKQVNIYKMGFGDKQERVEINLHAVSLFNSLHVKNHGAFDQGETIEIGRLDDFAEAHNIETIDFLKIDTEGHELHVLKGAEKLLMAHRIKMIYIESGPVRKTEECFVSYQELTDAFYAKGYELFGIYDQQPHWNGRKSILYFNPVFICSEWAAKDK